mgnify:CR=1 FL=1
MIKFTIIGKPVALKRHRPSARGGYYDPSSKDKKQIWLQIAKYKPKQPFVGDVMMKVIFTIPYPKKFYRTGKYKHLLKDSVPEYVSVRPDIDNYLKLLFDLLQGTDRYFVDDSQVVRLQAEKVYGRKGKTEVVIEEI